MHMSINSIISIFQCAYTFLIVITSIFTYIRLQEHVLLNYKYKLRGT